MVELRRILSHTYLTFPPGIRYDTATRAAFTLLNSQHLQRRRSSTMRVYVVGSKAHTCTTTYIPIHFSSTQERMPCVWSVRLSLLPVSLIPSESLWLAGRLKYMNTCRMNYASDCKYFSNWNNFNFCRLLTEIALGGRNIF